LLGNLKKSGEQTEKEEKYWPRKECIVQDQMWMDCIYPETRVVFRGLIRLETTYKTTTIGLDTYLSSANDPQRFSN